MTTQSGSSRLGQVLGGIAVALVFVGLGVWMIVQPDTQLGDGPSGRKGGLFFAIIRFIWGMPGGILLALLGALILFGSIKGEPQDADTSDAG